MASFTTQRSGNWSDTNAATRPWSTLTGSGTGGVPGLGDTINVATGHTLTMTSDQTCGTSGTSNYTADIAVAGTFVIGSRHLTIFGGLAVQTGGHLTGGPGGVLEITSNSTYQYMLVIDANSANMVNIAGAAGNPFTIKSTSTLYQAQVWFTTYHVSSATSTSWSYCNFLNLGYQGLNQCAVLLNGAEGSTTFANCTWTGCNNPINFYTAIPGYGIFTMSNCSMTGSTGSQALYFHDNNVAMTTGTRSVTVCSFDIAMSSTNGYRDFTFRNNYFGQGWGANGIGPWAIMDSCLVRQTNAVAASPYIGPMTNNLFVADVTGSVNNIDPNVVTLRGIFIGNTVDACFGQATPTGPPAGNIFQSNASDNNGAFFYGDTGFANTANHIYCRYNLSLPNINPIKPGASASVFNCSAMPTGNSIYVEHNTGCVDTGVAGVPLLLYSDLATTNPGTIKSFQSNLAVAFNAAAIGNGNALATNYTNGAASLDAMVYTSCGYNGGFNLIASDPSARMTTLPLKNGYVNGNMFAAGHVPLADTTDIREVDPKFFDRTRDLSTAWAKLLGNSTTGTTVGDWRATIAYLSTNPIQTSSVGAWIKAGWRPTNTAYRNAGHDGNDIGAVPGVYFTPTGSIFSPVGSQHFSVSF